MDLSLLTGPAGVAAGVAGVISAAAVINSLRVVRLNHWEKLAFDSEQAERKANAEIALAEKKFRIDIALVDQKRRQDLAEELLSGFYQARDLIRAIRSPVSFEAGSAARTSAEQELETVSRMRDLYHAPIARFETRRQAIADLMAKRYRAAAWFGSDADKAFDDLNAVVHQIIASAQKLVRSSGSADGDQNPAWRKWEADIWWGLEEPDRLEVRIETAIQDLERICRPTLKARLL